MLIQQIMDSSLMDALMVELGRDELSPATRGQFQVLNQSIVGLKKVLPRSVLVCKAGSPAELQSRASDAQVEIDGVLERLTTRRPTSHRGRPWTPRGGASQRIRRL